MPSAANAKSEKPASSEATDNSPIRQIIVILEHKIRNLEKRKGKLTSYRDIQKTGKELNADQKIAVAKYDEVAQTLEFAKDLSKQISSIAISADRDAKKQAKKEAWVRNAAETSKIREVLLILDCLNQMGTAEARNDFLSGSNGAIQLTEDDLKILDDLYPEVTPKHELNEEGLPGFQSHVTKAAEHLYSIVDGKPKEALGTTYARIKEIVMSVHECGYFEKSLVTGEIEEGLGPTEEAPQEIEEEVEPSPVVPVVYVPPPLPVPPAPAVVPAPAYPLRPIPPITLQEVEHAYFAQQYPQQRPISEVIGSQNFFFLQESELDSPINTPQPPVMNHSPSAIPTQTFTNQHYVPMPGQRVPPDAGALPIPQTHFTPVPDHPAFANVPLPTHVAPMAPPVLERHIPPQNVAVVTQPQIPTDDPIQSEENTESALPTEDKNDDWKDSQSPDRDDLDRQRSQGQGDGQNRFKRYGRGARGPSNGYRGRGGYSNRNSNEGYHNRHNDYQNRPNKDGYQNRQYNDNYQSRHKENYNNRGSDNYYGNGDTGNGHENNGGRERYENTQSYQGGFKGRGRGGARGGPRGASRPPRTQHYNRKQENVE